MAATDLKKRKRGDEKPSKRKIKIRKQTHYLSSSGSEPEDTFNPVDLAQSDSDSGLDSAEENNDDNTASSRTHTKSKKKIDQTSSHLPPAELASISASDSDSDSDGSSLSSKPPHPSSNGADKPGPSKRNDPTAFASSISAILSSKLSTAKRADPVLSRSATAADANTSLANAKLEAQARQKIRQDKKAALEKGRVKDVLLGTDDPAVAHGPKPADEKGAAGGADADAGDEVNEDEEQEGQGERVKEMQEAEKRLRKTAQRGVVKLFNAVRQAQVRAEEAAKEATANGVVGRARREEKMGEMSRKGFLEMVAAGGTSAQREGAKKLESARIEEA